MKVVVVESPAKAKTINKYLGRDYEVIASFGHIRDLPAIGVYAKAERIFDTLDHGFTGAVRGPAAAFQKGVDRVHVEEFFIVADLHHSYS